jgi:rubrerythrin
MQQGTAHSPVDNETYDLLQTLTSKLEAIETYQRYEQDAQGQAKQLIQEIAAQDRQHAERLVALLRDRLGNPGGTSSTG